MVLVPVGGAGLRCTRGVKYLNVNDCWRLPRYRTLLHTFEFDLLPYFAPDIQAVASIASPQQVYLGGRIYIYLKSGRRKSLRF